MPSYTKEVKVSGKSGQELYEKVSSEIERFLEKASLGKYELVRSPEKRQVELKSSMLTATLFCTDGLFKLDGKLSLMALPFKAKIDAGIERWIQKSFQS